MGWDITVDNVTTHLSVLDVLPITGFSWIPKDYYNEMCIRDSDEANKQVLDFVKRSVIGVSA